MFELSHMSVFINYHSAATYANCILNHNVFWSNYWLLYLRLVQHHINQAVSATWRAQGSTVVHCLGDAQKTEGYISRVVDKLNVHKRILITALVNTFLQQNFVVNAFCYLIYFLERTRKKYIIIILKYF